MNLIYQCWTGDLREGCKVSRDLMQEYVVRIGADYRLDIDPHIAEKYCGISAYYEWLNPIVDRSFLEYDKVLSVDLDVYPVDGLEENIFDRDIGDIGICTEPFQPKYRTTHTIAGHINHNNDEMWATAIKDRWGVEMPREDSGLLKVYNAGVVLFSNQGILNARDRFAPFREYIEYIQSKGFGRFYWMDQNYIHAMLEVGEMDYTELDNGWNSYVHYTGNPGPLVRPVNDSKTDDTKFVHVQLRRADNYDKDRLWDIVNLPSDQWKSNLLL